MSAPIVAVRPRAAALMLSIGKTKLYELIESGDGRKPGALAWPP